MKVLLVEDEHALADEIVSFLTQLQYECETASTVKAATAILTDRYFDIILLDLGLPDGDGLDILKTIKMDQADSIIVILSAKGDIKDRIEGLELGADDYLPKPFSLAELHARIQAIIRRKFATNGNVFQIGDFSVDMSTRIVYFKGQQILLYKKEFDILSYLILNRNRPLSRSQLYEHVWGDLSISNGDSNYIDVHIKNIRKKLVVYASVDWLESVRGIGYKINLSK
ncbi:response regulator transcription factor [Pedobacter nyackensis]|uniref:DNA-binding response regulator, OmpR family, contains REC and winged-helix (WHTH) domain n=1 Tax=Pedobacter nyackensis TaxID=475255 RepID=A0A1W2AQL9_9SPHI|nr:response regulator transcription factor [Pedobacter nyackensis]SMC62822.1 DNA-binding response regulator, OmpR family, contains REC and winged-helix (wHTH) domain [Pedobacter nyackensis]